MDFYAFLYFLWKKEKSLYFSCFPNFSYVSPMVSVFSFFVSLLFSFFVSFVFPFWFPFFLYFLSGRTNAFAFCWNSVFIVFGSFSELFSN